MVVVLQLLALLLLTFVKGAAQQQEPGGDGFIFNHDSLVSVPLTIHVSMVGFDGTGYASVVLRPDGLQALLKKSQRVSTRRPNCIETGQELPVEYDIQYRVSHGAGVRALEQVVGRNMRPAGETEDGIPLYDVEVTDIEDQLEAVFEQNQHVNRSSSASPKHPATSAEPYTIVLLNLDKERMRTPARQQQGTFFYRYRYNGSVPSQIWVGRHRYVVVDVSAGPAALGPSHLGAGAVTAQSVPSLELALPSSSSSPPAPSPKFLASVCALVVSATRHVFAPDLQFSSADHLEKLIVPIMVFRNHRRFDPLTALHHSNDRDTQGFGIDLANVRAEVRKMILPEQELLMPTALHSLSDHPHVATAVFKALKGDTVHAVDESGRYSSKSVPYLDSRTLLDEMLHSADELATTLLHSHSLTSHASSGHRILPVYVFSLLGLPRDLLLDRYYTHTRTPSGVLVLQTGANGVELPYFSEDGSVRANTRAPTRVIVAGIASVLGGLAHPYDTYSPSQPQATQQDYRWAVGHHPFGPFATAPHLSQTLLDAILRNAVVARLAAALAQVRRAHGLLHAFERDYSVAPGMTVAGSGSGTGSVLPPVPLWLDAGARQTFRRLTEELRALESQFGRLSSLLASYALREAAMLASSVGVTAQSFAAYVEAEVGRARDELSCCRVGWRMVRAGLWRQALSWVGIVVVGVVVFEVVRRQLAGRVPRHAPTTRFFPRLTASSSVTTGRYKQF